MTETRTRRPVRYDATSKAWVPLTDAELAAEGWVRLPDFTYRKES